MAVAGASAIFETDPGRRAPAVISTRECPLLVLRSSAESALPASASPSEKRRMERVEAEVRSTHAHSSGSLSPFLPLRRSESIEAKMLPISILRMVVTFGSTRTFRSRLGKKPASVTRMV